MVDPAPGGAPGGGTLFQCLAAGAVAGVAVDTVLFPLDTVKTRLQSRAGFAASGGLRGIYSGLASAAFGAAPASASFFLAYEYFKAALTPVLGHDRAAAAYLLAASAGEVAACVVRVPTDVIKQRLQTNQYRTTLDAIRGTWSVDGPLGFYRAYFTTVLREIPFACIQFPLYEMFKQIWGDRKERAVTAGEAALCGSAAGGLAAAATTPLDVVKTRMMLSTKANSPAAGFISTARAVSAEGPSALFRGVCPRVLWISIGGSIFLGAYEKSKAILEEHALLFVTEMPARERAAV